MIDVEFLDPDGRVRVHDESGRQIGDGPLGIRQRLAGRRPRARRFNVVTKPTTSRPLTITTHGCDLKGPRRGRAAVLRPTGSELADA